ncbi:MAG TPA: methyltransferase domain-containing protein [Bacteroidales bacterium]|jgi:Methylase involved in ubiquinone/menaquinone biosynthesis
MNELSENKKYKDIIKTALKKDKEEFCPFRKEKQMDYLFSFLKKDFNNKGMKVLDACCGYGRLIHFLNEFDPNQNYIGIDYVEELINDGKRRFASFNNVRFEHYDIMHLEERYHKEFDITINYKTLSWLPYYTTIIEQLIKVTKQKIYISSLFYDGDIDFITRIYVDAKDSKEDTFNFLNTYSFPKFEKFCLNLNVKKVKSIDMKLDFDLDKPSNMNKLQTYTVMTQNGERLELTGNIILNWKLVELVL